ncbi:hypothetical protein CCH79_00016637 [Gambusia affinis]|uniref:AB hydrolase-1 domain-containing protein n=1 Tax=Gambusia affinis TaxID=33528 RepID=A0A315UVI3_GAMAF|nr:hypothetical protein CCH79_00016637 [Gambusia affinis]
MKEWWIHVGLICVPLVAVYLHIPAPHLSATLQKSGIRSRSASIESLHWTFLDLVLRPHRYSIFEQASIVEALVAHLGLSNQRLNLISHDYGDTVALELLYRSDQNRTGHLNYNSLCLTNGGIFPETHHPRLLQTLLKDSSILATFLTRLTNFLIFQKGIGEVFGPYTQPTDAEFWDMWTSLRYNDGNLVLDSTSIRDFNIEIDGWERSHPHMLHQGILRLSFISTIFSHCCVSVHMIYGPLDPVNPHPQFIRLYMHLVKRSTVTILDDHISHYPQLEDPTGFLKAYFNFIHSF